MINGHGDNIYQYPGIRCNFSSNISPLIDTSLLRRHLAGRLAVISHYPEPSARSLEALIADSHHISPDEVLVTSGATDAIYLTAQTLRDERSFTVERPTFSEYADACRMYGYEERPLDGAVGWLCNPNNPTGDVCTTDHINQLSLRHHWLVVDQSYEDYTLAPLLTAQTSIKMQNVIVIHSMTKRFAIPGLRIGYIIAPSAVISRLRANCRPWAVNSLAIEAGCWLMEHKMPYYREEMELLLSQTKALRERLCGISGLHVYPTSTNFMLCSIQQSTAADLKEYLLSHHGFLIRDASNFEGLSAGHFRIATQLPEYNDELVEAVKTYVNLLTKK